MGIQGLNGHGRLYDANMHSGETAANLMDADTLAAARAHGVPVVIEFPTAYTIHTTGEGVTRIDEPEWCEVSIEVDKLGEEELTPFVRPDGVGRAKPTERTALDLETGDDLRAFIGRGARVEDVLAGEL